MTRSGAPRPTDVSPGHRDTVRLPVLNETEQRRAARKRFQAQYRALYKEVLEILLQVARAHPDVLVSPASTALFMGFGDSSLNFELRIWTPDYDTYVRVASDLRASIFAAFKEAGIQIPFPQRDVHVKSTDLRST